MCNLGMAVEMNGIQKGIQQGIQQTRLESILSLMDTLKMNAQQAMDALKIPKNEQEGYAAKIASLH